MNWFLIVCALIILYCLIHGAKKGMLSIVFGMCAWIFVIWFINFSVPYISDFITDNTEISSNINEHIKERMEERYINSEEKEEGSGKESLIKNLPASITEKVNEAVNESEEQIIKAISEELTSTAISGIAIILACLVSVLLLFVMSKLISLIGIIPGIRGINKVFGVVAGALEAILIIWFIMLIADCFPASAFGQFVLGGTAQDQMLGFVHDNNFIKLIVGI